MEQSEIVTQEQFKFDPLFQKKIIKIMLDDPNVLIKATKHTKKEYFTSDPLRFMYKVLSEYFKEFNIIPTPDVFTNEVRKEQEKKTDTSILFEYLTVIREIFNLKVEDKDYLVKELQQWLKDRAFAECWLKAKDAFNNSENSEKAKEIAEEGLHKVRMINFEDTTRSFFFDDVKNRVLQRHNILEREDNVIPTGIIELDQMLEGGVSKGQLAVVGADSGKGKSICLMNIGANCVRERKVLHITLEGMDLELDTRYDARILHEDYNKVVRNQTDTNLLKNYDFFGNNLVIITLNKRFLGYSILDIEEELNHLKGFGFNPDVIIVDYGDLLKSNKFKNDDKYQAQGNVFQELKILANRGYVVWTATQFNRTPLSVGNPKDDPAFFFTRNSIADSYEKLRPCDIFITLNRTDAEKQSNRMRIYLDKCRDKQDGRYISINTNYSKMQFYVASTDSIAKANNG